MKNILYTLWLSLFFSALAHAQLSWQGGITPEQNQAGVLVFDATGTPLAGNTSTLYVHTGITLNGAAWQNVIGSWGNNTTQPALTPISGNLYELNITPDIMSFYGVGSGSITAIHMVVRNAAGNTQTADLLINVGNFQMSLISPLANSINIWNTGGFLVQAQNTGGAAPYTLTDPNGQIIDSSTGSSYNHSISSPVSGSYTLSATKNGITISQSFTIVVGQVATLSAMPTGVRDGVNYYNNDLTKATLVLNAPFKDFVYVVGSFNNWQPLSQYVMKKDPVSGKFWIDIEGLTPGDWYAFQYWVCANAPYANSPKVVKTADPFSTLVLSAFDDPEINALGVYQGLPSFSSIAPNQEREVSVIQTGPSAYWQYNWNSPAKANTTVSKKDLVIYELLIRDFDANRTYQDIIDRIDYFKDLKINAIQLMPVMEFEGNMSWGYNPVYHMAPDKRYGSPAKLKELIDVCHQNNIAVILDIALNHVFGRSPLERMWMIDTDNDGWSNAISPENPYCNTEPKHTGNVGADLNHFREPDNLTNTYVLRTLETWINDYRIDGFRWDLTQGFTNNCSANDGNCTGSNQPDRIAKLQWYADKQWELDPNFYVIFEHWAFGEIPLYTNYRLNENPSKGILCWRRADYEFTDLLKGNYANISNTTDAATYRIQGNMESHDEERIVYKAVTQGGQTNGNLNKALARMPAAGAVFFLAPGPKMIWHFAELGWNLSINTCSNGSISNNCRLDTKPQPQWTQNWLNQPERRKIYDDWSKLIDLRTKEDVFESGQYAFNLSLGNGRPRLDVWTSTQPTNSLSYVMVHTNFSNSPATFPAYFPFTGTWYNLMDNTALVVNSTADNITLPADGGFVVYGNAPNPHLGGINYSNANLNEPLKLKVQNPAHDRVSVYYEINQPTASLRLLTLNGRLIETRELKQNEKVVQLNLNIPQGLYLLELSTIHANKTVKLLVQ